MAFEERVESSSNESQFNCQIQAYSEFAKYLFVTGKGSFKWEGDFESLKQFLEEILNEETKWFVPCGGCKQFKNAAVDIRWYSTSKSLIIKGLECDDLKTRLRILASETNEEQSGEDDANLNKFVNINNTDSTMQSNVLCDNCSDLAKRVDLLEERMNENLSGISKTLNGLRAKEDLKMEFSREYIGCIQRENVKLKHDNETLRERAENLSYIASDLNTKVKQLENEKECLITALGLLKSNLSEQQKATDDQTIKGLNKGADDCHGCKSFSASSINSSNETGNRFESLIYVDDDELDHQETPHKANANKKQNQQRKASDKKRKDRSNDNAAHSAKSQEQKQDEDNRSNRTNNNRGTQKTKKNMQTKEALKPNEDLTPEKQKRHAKQTVVIAGDSVIKYVKGWELSNAERNVSVKSFSGATIGDMSDFLKPTARKQPDKLIIHTGTNDLRRSSPTETATKIIELAEDFQKDCKHTKVIISSIVTRCDKEDIGKKVNETNNMLKAKCLKNNIAFLDNSNIGRSHLNSRGLHLNKEGTSVLQTNILQFLNSYN